MKHVLVTLPVLFMSLLLACSSDLSVAENLDNEDIDYGFYSDSDYKTVYLRIYTQAQKCIKSIGISKPKVTGEINEDNKSAKIDIALQGISGSHIYMPVRILTENQATRVKVKNSYRRWDAYALAVKEWSLDGTKECISGQQ